MTPASDSKEGSGGVSGLERVCDPCYRRILHDAKRWHENLRDRCRIIASPTNLSNSSPSMIDLQEISCGQEESFLVDANDEHPPISTIITQEALERLNLENWREAINKTPVTDIES